MRIHPRTIHNFKQIVLVVTVLYFYTLAFALGFHKDALGMDRPLVFLCMSALFVFALLLETILSWWDRRAYLLWGALAVAAYGVLGLIVAPTLYGSSVLLYALIEPLVVVFVGGFAFSYGRIVADHLYAQVALTNEQADVLLEMHPGWKRADVAITKTYVFSALADALNFVNQVGRMSLRMHRLPHSIRLSGSRVIVQLSSGNGLTLTDIHHAQRIDALG